MRRCSVLIENSAKSSITGVGTGIPVPWHGKLYSNTTLNHPSVTAAWNRSQVAGSSYFQTYFYSGNHKHRTTMSNPSSTSPYNVAKSKETGYVEVNRLTPCLGVCCLFLSCYTDWPDCIGAVSEVTCCCLSHKHVMCKPAAEETSYCKFCLCDCDCDPMTTLCSVSATQTCCAVYLNIYNH